MVKHITEQKWGMQQVEITGTERRTAVRIVAEDGSVVCELQRPDLASDELMAGYIVGCHLRALAERKKTHG